MSLYEKALMIALKAHDGQVDKGGEPYILHPLRLAAKFAGCPGMYAAALCHDVVEDTFGKPNQITLLDVDLQLGGEVAALVGSLTRRKPGMFRIHGWVSDEIDVSLVERNETYEEYITRIKVHPEAIPIKIEDLYDNLDPRRHGAVPEDELERLSKRYHRALKILKGQS